MREYYKTMSKIEFDQFLKVFNKSHEPLRVIFKGNDFLGCLDDEIIADYLKYQEYSNELDFLRAYGKYKNVILEYLQITKKLDKLIGELGLADDLFEYYVTAVDFMLMGLLSDNKHFAHKDISNSLDIDGYEGINVIKGSGCCRHSSNLLVTTMEPRYKVSNLLVSSVSNGTSDHAICLAKEGKHYYGFETLNGKDVYVLKKDSGLYSLVAEVVCYPNAGGTMIINCDTIKEVKDTFDDLYSSKSPSEDDVIIRLDDAVDKSYELCYQNKSLIRDFRTDIESHIQTISRTRIK